MILRQTLQSVCTESIFSGPGEMPVIISLIAPEHYPEEQRMLIDYLYVMTIFIDIWIQNNFYW